MVTSLPADRSGSQGRVPRPVSRADALQRRHPVLGLPLAVIYKFFDDQGNYLAAVLTYYAFVAIFPLMLLGSSILGFFLEGRPQLRRTCSTRR